MNRLALAASLLLWGWHTGRLPVALLLLVIVEGGGLQRRRWHLGDGDWQRVLLVSAVLLVGVAVYAANAASLPASLFVGMSWLPLALIPLVVVQRVSADPGVPFSVFLAAPAPGKYLDFALPFAATTLFAAASSNTRSEIFFPALVAACALGLWPLRRPGVNPLAWLAVLGVVAALGYVTADGLVRAQAEIEQAVIEWLSSDTLDADSERTTTRIGSMGRIKLSSKVVLRVRPTTPTGPLHLAEAMYDGYVNGTWLVHSPVPSLLGPGSGTWDLGGTPARESLRIEARLKEGQGVLPLPFGTARITGLNAERVERNHLGTVRVEGAGTLIGYSAQTGAIARPPGPYDLDVPTPLLSALRKFEADSHVAELPPAQRIAALTRFFDEHYRYTLALGDRKGRHLALFLTTDRAGHCEYFASATVLALRHTGVPARYVVGFLAHDYSELENAYLVRARDAHAWAMAWIDGAWRLADTTPANWPELEDADAPLWDPVAQAFSRAWFAARAWWHEDANAPLKAGAVALVAGLIVLVWLWRKQRSEANAVARSAEARPREPYADTPFAAIAQRLARVSPPFGAHETPRQWIARAALHERVRASGPLDEILALHYVQRYDPRAERDDRELRRRVGEWVARFDTAPGR